MADVLFATWSGGGNLPPALTLAAELARRGDTVRFMGHDDQRGAIEAAGFEFEPYASGRQWRGADDTNVVAYFAMWVDHRLGDDVVASITARPVDYVVADCMLLGVLQAVQRAGVPNVALVHSFLDFFEGWARGPIVLFGLRRGLKAIRLWDQATLVLVTALPELDAASGRKHGNRQWIGPLVPPVENPSAGTEILVSLSTTKMAGQEKVLQNVLDALATLPVTAIVTTGPAIAATGLRIPDGTEVHDYLPHDEAMARARLVVGHGGHGTTMRALSHGLPLVMLPLHATIDQPMVAGAVDFTGAGIRLPMKAPHTVIASAVQQVLDDPAYSRRAGELGARIRSMNAAALAADAIAAALAPV